MFGYKFKKLFIYFVNFIFALVSLTLIGFGLWLKDFMTKVGLDSSKIFGIDIAIIFGSAGGFILLICLFGLLGSLRENISLMKLYMVVITLIVIAEATGAALFYYYKDAAFELLSDHFFKEIQNYNPNEVSPTLIDIIQVSVGCCGANAYSDWAENKYFSCSSKSFAKCSLPFTCCVLSDSTDFTCGANALRTGANLTNIINTEGCSGMLRNIAITNLYYILGGLGGLILIEIILVIINNSSRVHVLDMKAKITAFEATLMSSKSSVLDKRRVAL